MKPSGNVTFLFTDIEGSTKLAQDFPETLSDALNIHNNILSKVFESCNGFVFKIIGDAYCCAFEKAEDAVKSAVEVQLNLAAQEWKDAEIKIRIGIHTGKAKWNGEEYSGYITLARTARVMSAAYGEQIIISRDVYELIKDKFELPKPEPERKDMLRRIGNEQFANKEISFRDLGERRLKDLNQPVRLFQVISDGLRADFPPLKSLDARPNNLPVQLTNFIGREEELKHAKELLKVTHLLTLTGSGGTGKTRFSLQTAADLIDDFASGVWFIELAAINDPLFLPQTILSVLGMKEEQNRTCAYTLIEYLKDKELLIILDNCEHIIDACAELTEKLLSSCPRLRIIATSREALNCLGEQTYRIPPLTKPDTASADTPEQLNQFESVRMFIERAQSVDPDFRLTNKNAHALAGICSRLDGVPLAIELAASRTKVLTVEKIYEKLDDRFNLLTGGRRTALPRQQTLKALIDWSFDLLTGKEQTLWISLSVFTGGWTLDAAEEVCCDESIKKNEILDLLSQLTEKSIIIHDDSNERYRILESLKQYGKEKLSEGNAINLKHLCYFLNLSEKAKPEFSGNEIKHWLDRLEGDHSNFQYAIEWAAKNNELEKSAEIASALGKFWEIRGHFSTGLQIIDIIFNVPEKLNKSLKAKLLNWKGYFNYRLGDFDQAQLYFKESIVLSKESGDKPGIAVSLNGLGNTANSLGDYEHAEKYLKESLGIQEEIGDKLGQAKSYNNLGNVAYYRGDYEKAQHYFEEFRLIAEELGDKRGIAKSLNNLGNSSIYLGDFDLARQYYEESLEIYREIGDKPGISESLNGLGGLALNLANYDKALNYYEECMEIAREVKDKRGIATALLNFGNIAFFQENFDQAQQYYKDSLILHREIRDKRAISTIVLNLGIVAFSMEDYELSQNYYEESLSLHREIGDKRGIAITLGGMGKIGNNNGNLEKAIRHLSKSLKLFSEMGIKNRIASSLNYFAGVLIKVKQYSKAAILLSASEKEYESSGGALEKNEQRIKDENIEKLHEIYSEKEFAKLVDDGKKLTLEEAVELALSDNKNSN